MTPDTFAAAASRAWHAAARLLGWRPGDFWNSTPVELTQALEPPADSAAPPEAGRIAALLERFPDEKKART